MSALGTIEELRGVHAGKRLFILASGPSLATLDLSRLERRLVMGLNRSFLAYPRTHYNCTMDQRLFDLYPDELRQTRQLFTLEGRPWGIPLTLLGAEGFSLDLARGIYSGYTIAYFAMQVATYLGFTELVYLGLDLKHDAGNTHFFGTDFHSENHECTEFPRMRRMLQAGARVLMDHGVRIYSCSPLSSLRGFDSVSYDHALSL
jgi:hypothetical protein